VWAGIGGALHPTREGGVIKREWKINLNINIYKSQKNYTILKIKKIVSFFSFYDSPSMGEGE